MKLDLIEKIVTIILCAIMIYALIECIKTRKAIQSYVDFKAEEVTECVSEGISLA